MTWIVLLLVVVIIVWVHCARGMSFRDRINAALDIVESSHFVAAEGFEDARREDADLMGWVKADKDCVMLFRSEHGAHVKEVVDVASGSFHPGLVVHFEDGRAVRTDEGELTDEKLRGKAEELLKRVRRVVQQIHPELIENYDGFHY